MAKQTTAAEPAAKKSTAKTAKDDVEMIATETLDLALLMFQRICPPLRKESTAGSGQFQYKYGSLPMILDTIGESLFISGLTIMQPITLNDDGQQVLKTMLTHAPSGDDIVSEMIIKPISFKGMNEIQSMGAVISYLRRYALISILGIIPDDMDTDAAGDTKAQPKGRSSKNTASNAPAAAEKPWLNPMVGGKVNPTWTEAVKYLAGDGTMESIKTKYRIAKPNESKLQNEALSYNDIPGLNNVDDIAPGQSNLDFDNQGPDNGESDPQDNPEHY